VDGGTYVHTHGQLRPASFGRLCQRVDIKINRDHINIYILNIHVHTLKQKIKWSVCRPYRMHVVHRCGLLLHTFHIAWHMGELCINDWTDWDGAREANSCGSKEPCIRWGSRSPMGKGTFERDM